jgi:benzoylformate decarboxylase
MHISYYISTQPEIQDEGLFFWSSVIHPTVMTTQEYTGGNLFVDSLTQYGVTHLFGNPGTTELPVLKSLAHSEMEYILTLHEDIAVGLAAGYASARRYYSHRRADVNPLGVANLHVAPGVAHGLGNLQNAAWAGAPLLVTAGNHSTDFQHEEPILSGDLQAMVRDYTKWNDEVQAVSELPTMLRRAVRTALTPPTGPVFLSLPMDVMMANTDAEPESLGSIPRTGSGDPAQLSAATDHLGTADDLVVVLGDQIARSGREAIDAAIAFAEQTGAAVYSEMNTSELNFPPDHKQWVSFLPPDADKGRVMLDADTLVFVGCTSNLPYIPYDEKYIPADATTIAINQNPKAIGKNEPVSIGIIGDPGLIMEELADRTAETIPEDERARRRSTVSVRRAKAEELVAVPRQDRDDGSISKPALADTLAEATSEAYVVNESNTSKYPLLTRWKLGPEQFISNKNGGLGYGLPASIGAAIAWEQASSETKSVIGFVGDGSYLYYPQSMYTAARYDLDVTVVVPDNQSYRILKEGMLDIYGGAEADHEFVGMDIDPAVDIVANAESHNVEGHHVTTRNELSDVLTTSIAADEPRVVDVHVHD